jgi:hypothetical protein
MDDDDEGNSATNRGGLTFVRPLQLASSSQAGAPEPSNYGKCLKAPRTGGLKLAYRFPGLCIEQRMRGIDRSLAWPSLPIRREHNTLCHR